MSFVAVCSPTSLDGYIGYSSAMHFLFQDTRYQDCPPCYIGRWHLLTRCRSYCYCPLLHGLLLHHVVPLWRHWYTWRHWRPAVSADGGVRRTDGSDGRAAGQACWTRTLCGFSGRPAAPEQSHRATGGVVGRGFLTGRYSVNAMPEKLVETGHGCCLWYIAFVVTFAVILSSYWLLQTSWSRARDSTHVSVTVTYARNIPVGKVYSCPWCLLHLSLFAPLRTWEWTLIFGG